jgi:hypothetical protein
MISKIPLEGNGTIEKKVQRYIVFFSLPVNLFLVSLVSRLYGNRLDVRPPRSAPQPCRDALAGFYGLDAFAG